MTTIRRRSLEIPTDDEGTLPRQCPRCQRQFSIDSPRYQDRGFMNLRCPYCGFIAELDRFTTGSQRQYMYSATQNMARRAAEQMVEEAFNGLSGFSGSDVEFNVDASDIDFGRVPVDPPIQEIDTEQVTCPDCEFIHGVEDSAETVCPVCR